MSFFQVGPVFFDGPYDSETFLLVYMIPTLCLVQTGTGVGDDAASTLVVLEQYGSDSYATSVGLQDEVELRVRAMQHERLIHGRF
jgi:hypothetical protein